jgi:ABC-type glutathione transport system ATPase component
LRNIERQLSQLDQVESDVHALQNRRIQIEDARNSLLDDLEETQEAVFEARDAVAREVSNQLGNRVIIAVEHLADAQQFKDTLTQLLHKSGLQYNSLAEGISRSLLPRQLLTLIESEDSSGLAAAAGITEDRAARAVGHLGDPSALAAIAACQLEDSVDFRLRDGSTTKSVEKLSTGQKCAATLPIVLTETTRTLILDQPEDHLDNAFLVDNIITALVGRSRSGAQTIVATHNANIPVLGSADRVITLESDGLRGSASHQGAYNSPVLVERITSLMEGGRAAFEHRAEFYRRFGSAG